MVFLNTKMKSHPIHPSSPRIEATQKYHPTRTQTCVHTHTHTHTTCTQTQTHTYPNTHTYTHTQGKSRMVTETHKTHTYTHTCPHTRTHTHYCRGCAIPFSTLKRERHVLDNPTCLSQLLISDHQVEKYVRPFMILFPRIATQFLRPNSAPKCCVIDDLCSIRSSVFHPARL